MKPATWRFNTGSVISPRKLRTERTKKSSPSGKTADREAARWLRMRSPSAAKCFGSVWSDASNEMRRVGTVRSGLEVCTRSTLEDLSDSLNPSFLIPWSHGAVERRGHEGGDPRGRHRAIRARRLPGGVGRRHR